MMESTREKSVQEARDEAAGALAVYDHLARLFLDPIEVPGTSYIIDLHERTKVVFGDAMVEGSGAVADMAAWLEEIEGLRTPEHPGNESTAALEEAQRLVAAERTRLCRGTSSAGPLPPYEEYYTDPRQDGNAAAPTSCAAVAEAYRQAGVHMDEDRKERDDYVGTELAFLAHLARCELASLDQDDVSTATAAREAREAFERDHLPWMRAYAEAALPHASTTLWKGMLAILGILAE